MPTFFLVGAVALFIMAFLLKNKNKQKTIFSFITGLLLLIFSIMGYLKYRNTVVVTILIVIYYLINAYLDIKYRKQTPSKLEPVIRSKPKKKKNK